MAMGVNPARLTVGGVFQDRYEVVCCIATGGMGAVYEVIDRDTQRHRALKVMLPRADEDGDLRKRFRREATVAAQVESEHVAEIIDAGVDGKTGAPFLVMELLKGEDLGQLLERRGALTAEQVVLYLWQVSLALDKTHAAKVVHRDLKPENLFVTRRDDGTPCIKLLDFGIAKAIRSEEDLADTTGGMVGTPLYISPEQVRGRIAPSGRSDSYALAQIAYTLLTGEPYWAPEREAAEDILPILMAVAEGPRQPATERAAERTGVRLPQDFDDWFRKATAAVPEERFDSCTALVDGLAEALGVDEPAPASVAYSPEHSAMRVPGAKGRDDEAPGAGDDDGPAPAAGSVTEAAVTRTLSESAGRARWPALLGAALVLAAVIWGATWLLARDPSVGPSAAGSSSAATAGPAAPSATTSATSAGAAASVPTRSAPTAAPSSSAPAARSTAKPRGTTTATRHVAPPATATGWAPPVTER
ncbi:MAG: serine/threonine protein kinase [Deltaproteobacteria bacterium]|nr:serine/threonine protein kinase [Deltaproteobacteria bacterium]